MATRRWDIAILALVLAIVAVSMVYLARLTPNEDPTIEQVLPPAQLAELEELRGRFGDGGDLVVVLLRSPAQLGAAEPLSAPGEVAARASPRRELQDGRLAEFEQALAALPGATRTWSRLTRPRLEYDGEKLSVVARPRLPSEPEGRLDRFLSPDPGSAVVLVALAPHVATLSGARAFTAALDRILLRERSQGDEALAVGSPILRVATWDAAARDATRMLPVLVAVVVIVPLVFFRSLWASLFPFVLAALSSGATLALNRIVSGSISPWMLVLLPLVWSVATMDAMHFYESARRHGAVDPSSVRAIRRELVLPCLLTAAITAVSLAVLAAPGGPALFRAVGVWGALGTAIAYALTFLLGGPLLRLMSEQRPLPRWPSALARRVVVWSARRARWVVGAWLALAIAAAAALPGLHVESRYPRVFADGAGGPFEEDLKMLPAVVGAELLPLEIHLEARSDRARRPESLVMATLGLHEYLGTLPEARLSLSVATLLHEWTRSDPRAPAALARAARDGNATRLAAALLADPRLSQWLRPGAGRSRMQVLFAKMSHARKEELLRFVQHYVGTVHPDYEVRFAGPLFVYHAAEREGISGIVQGAGLDLLLIFATFAVVFRRAWATISAVLVNLTPVLVLLGAMALAGVPWSLGLLGLPVVVLGLAVDDTVHLLWEARARTGRRPLGALLSAMRRNAGAVLSTCALLAGCLGALARSGFQVNHELGILLPLGLGLALFAELTLLPALLGLGFRAPRRRSARSSW